MLFLFPLERRETCSFLVRTRKERKEAASLRLDRSCGRQRFDGGYERRHPRSRISRDPSTAAIFVDIAPGSAHTARALRLRAQAFQTHRASARRMVACASSASTATPFEPWICTFQQKHGSLRRKPQRLFWYLFSLRRKVHIFSFVKERNVSFSCTNKKRTKRSRERSVRSSVRPAAVRWRL